MIWKLHLCLSELKFHVSACCFLFVMAVLRAIKSRSPIVEKCLRSPNVCAISCDGAWSLFHRSGRRWIAWPGALSKEFRGGGSYWSLQQWRSLTASIKVKCATHFCVAHCFLCIYPFRKRNIFSHSPVFPNDHFSTLRRCPQECYVWTILGKVTRLDDLASRHDSSGNRDKQITLMNHWYMKLTWK